jgi:beta-N-acetylhexosaminidase
MKPVFFGIAGLQLSEQEAALLCAHEPAGYILFGRNIADPAQVRALTDSLRALHGDGDVLIAIDQEGGRVSRLSPPLWPAFPAAAVFGDVYQTAPMTAVQAAFVNGKAMAAMLRELGINVNCAPLLDIRSNDTHAAIGDRSFGGDPMRVAALGQAMLDGMHGGGVCGVIKHMPGQGRANSDSHLALPHVACGAQDLIGDISPFATLRNAMLGMSGHVVYKAWDDARCASISPVVINEIIRGQIGFDGLLLSDDITMHALSGNMGDRAAACIDAGCDIALHCSGDIAEMSAVADALPQMSAKSTERMMRAKSVLQAPKWDEPLDTYIAARDALLKASS